MSTIMTESAGVLNQTDLLGNYYSRAVLQFFNRYPFTRFSKLAIARTLDVGNSMGIEEALKELIDKGLITVQSRHNECFYNLNEKKQSDKALPADVK